MGISSHSICFWRAYSGFGRSSAVRGRLYSHSHSIHAVGYN